MLELRGLGRRVKEGNRGKKKREEKKGGLWWATFLKVFVEIKLIYNYIYL